MMKINATAQKVFTALTAQFPNQTEFKRSAIHAIAIQLGYGTKNYKDLITDEFKIRKGLYNYATLIDPTAAKSVSSMNLAKSTDSKKPAKAAKKLKSDRTWKGKKIIDADGDFLAVESTDEKIKRNDEPSMPTGWRTSQSVIDSDGYVRVYTDGKLVSKYRHSEAGKNNSNNTNA
jgi:hypothetical protein